MGKENSEMAPPVVLQHRSVKFENSKWRVFADAIKGADGLEVPDYLTLVPKVFASNHVSGVCVLPFLKGGEAVLLGAYRHPLESYFWEGVRGFIDEGEAPEGAAARELLEETGLVAGALAPLGLVAPEPSTLIARVALFAATDCSRAATPLKDELGLGEVKVFAWSQVLAMAARGEIEDATTLLAIYRYAANR